ncbi:MAG: glycosyltransferase [Deltaproteobacteria bacterium]|nr:glycosyltransferase [Deltaproteobacteria bacterium]
MTMRQYTEQQDKTPICSVCIANFNGQDVIGSAIDSVIDQNAGFPVEIIVHDDGSTDDSVSYLEKYYPDVNLIVSPNNVGYCVSNNRMASRANGHYLLFLNNDACLFPGALQILHDYAESLETPAILGLPQYDMETGDLIDIGSVFDPFLNPIPNKKSRRKDVGMVIGACLWIPKSLWHDLGGFPEWFHTLAEDMYLCTLARVQGYPVTALSTSGYRHWVGRSIGGGRINQGRLVTTYRRRYYSERNKTYVMALCYPHLMFYLLIPLHIQTTLKYVIFRSTNAF